MRARLSIWLALLIAVAIHVDWHIGRGHHFRLSGGTPYHWLIAIPTFVCVAWIVGRHWSHAVHTAGMRTIVVGVLAGQIVEPFGELLFYRNPAAVVWGSSRWPIFAEFLAAGLLTYVIVLPFVWRPALETQSPP